MNALEQIVQDDVHRLVDRLASTVGEGTLARCVERCPEIRDQLELAEARLSEARRTLVESYAAWREALDDCGNVWAVAAARSDDMPVTERRAA
jgi:hypothetical protein